VRGYTTVRGSHLFLLRTTTAILHERAAATAMRSPWCCSGGCDGSFQAVAAPSPCVPSAAPRWLSSVGAQPLHTPQSRLDPQDSDHSPRSSRFWAGRAILCSSASHAGGAPFRRIVGNAATDAATLFRRRRTARLSWLLPARYIRTRCCVYTERWRSASTVRRTVLRYDGRGTGR
jgi:hypothetical protein